MGKVLQLLSLFKHRLSSKFDKLSRDYVTKIPGKSLARNFSFSPEILTLIDNTCSTFMQSQKL